MVYSLPYSFAPGEVARPQEVNANFNAIINQIEEINTTKANIDLSNISSDGMDNIKNSSLSKNIGELVFSTIPLTDAEALFYQKVYILIFANILENYIMKTRMPTISQPNQIGKVA